MISIFRVHHASPTLDHEWADTKINGFNIQISPFFLTYNDVYARLSELSLWLLEVFNLLEPNSVECIT